MKLNHHARRLFFTVSLALIAALLWNPPALEAKTGALTAPPPAEFQLLGFFDPGFTYLDYGSNGISDNGNKSVDTQATTLAKQSVSYVGATFYLERWTGEQWISVGNPVSNYSTNKSYHSNGVTFSAMSGFYYRVRTVHWVNHGSTQESGEVVSGYVLVQ